MSVQPNKAYYLLLAATILALAACNGDDPQTDSGVSPDKGPPVDQALGDAKGDTGGTTVDQKIKPDGPKKPAHWTLLPDTDIPMGVGGTATLLSDGKVLFAGGSRDVGGNDEYSDKAYLYLPVQKKFMPTGKMTMARGEHTATLLKDGRVLVAGGKNSGAYLKAAEFYNPSTGKWSAAKSMYESRWAHAAVRLNKDGMVLVTGGFGSSDSISSMTIYHPGQKDWLSPSVSMGDARRNHTMTKLKSGKVLIAGGITGSSFSKWKSLDTLELFNENGTIEKVKAIMHWKRNAHTANLVPSTGNVLLVGGICWGTCTGTKVNDLYKPASNTVTTMSYLGKPPVGHVGVVLKDGRVLIIGSNESDAALRKKVVSYTPGGGLLAWKSAPSMTLARSHPLAVTLNDGTVIVTAGIETSSPYKYAEKAELFTP